MRTWDEKRWASCYAPGKWTAAQIILHLAQDEIGWSNRIRLAPSVDGYVVQAYDADRWITWETPTEPQTALDAFLALRRPNLILYRRISLQQRSRPFPHPELGEISIEWIIDTLAGHDLHHLRHLETNRRAMNISATAVGPRDRIFYTGMSLAALAAVFAGFAKTWWPAGELICSDGSGIPAQRWRRC